MIGLAAVATTINAMHPPAFFAYLLGLMLPLTFRVLVEQDETHTALGIMLLLFLVVMLGSGHFLNKFILLSLRQRFENESLAHQLAGMNDVLEHKVEERTAQLQRKTEEVSQIRDVTIMAMASLAETRDNETGNHLKRTQQYIRALAMKLRNHPQFRDFLTEDNIESLYKLAPLHDIGKVGIPDAILLKQGKLTPEEFEIMKTHPLLGGNAIAMAESGLPTPNRFLHIAREIANGHHEKWNGSGYPLGLKGEAIPISARLMALADVYDALISRRVYKEPFTHQAAVAYILQGSGTHFDPAVIDAFLAIQEEFRQIAEQYQD
jgi:putative two-component system response regulator